MIHRCKFIVFFSKLMQADEADYTKNLGSFFTLQVGCIIESSRILERRVVLISKPLSWRVALVEKSYSNFAFFARPRSRGSYEVANVEPMELFS